MTCSIFDSGMRRYLRGVCGLLFCLHICRGLGSKENASFKLSNTDGATYVNPYKHIQIMSEQVLLTYCATVLQFRPKTQIKSMKLSW